MLNMVGDIGSLRLKRLLDCFGSPENIFRIPQDKLMSVAGIGGYIAEKIHALDREDLAGELKLARRLGLKIMTYEDKDYPQNLKNIPDPPIVLYVKGRIESDDRLGVAIVGSRRASFYGLTNAERFAYNLSEKGLTIVSGMALGVDTAAHKGALRAGGRTLAVIGSGFHHLYPPQNKELAQDIARNGAVISEFPVNTEPFRQNFPRRNRVISGLSLGVLVVEAARNSGALITADFALEQGREVFALPGGVDSLTSFGTNALIKQGAKLVSSVDDILEEFDVRALGIAGNALKEDRSVSDTICARPDLSDAEEVLYNAISEEPVPLDEIVERTSLDVATILDIIMRLQLKRLIRQLPGKQFARRDNER